MCTHSHYCIYLSIHTQTRMNCWTHTTHTHACTYDGDWDFRRCVYWCLMTWNMWVCLHVLLAVWSHVLISPTYLYSAGSVLLSFVYCQLVASDITIGSCSILKSNQSNVVKLYNMTFVLIHVYNTFLQCSMYNYYFIKLISPSDKNLLSNTNQAGMMNLWSLLTLMEDQCRLTWRE